MARVVVDVMPKAEILDPQGQAIVGAAARASSAVTHATSGALAATGQAIAGSVVPAFQQLLAFYTSEILEPNWHELERKLRAARSVDQFMKDHFDFLNVCRKECMLTDYRYLEVRYPLDSPSACASS